MPIVGHRRHSLWGKPGQDLTQSGVALARRVGAGEFGPVPAYDLMITSTVPRAFQTAIAMGFAVDEQFDEFATMGPAVFAEYRWPRPIGEAAPVLLGSGPAGEYAVWQAELLKVIAGRLPDDGRRSWSHTAVSSRPVPSCSCPTLTTIRGARRSAT